MSRGLPKNIKENLEKCKDSAVAAVTLYNSPALVFKTPSFIVLIILSWTAFFHAFFYKKNKKPWYKKEKTNKYLYIEGEPRHWALADCLKEYFKDKHPAERKNLEFLIGLRNKIEHRNLPEFDSLLFGECQSCLLNLEEIITETFGIQYGLMKTLNISLQFSTLIPDKKKSALKKLIFKEKDVISYIQNFRIGLNNNILNDQKFSFNVFVIPKVVNSKNVSDTSVEVISTKNLDEEQQDRIKKLNILIKEKKIPIVNLDYYRPSEVVKQVQSRLTYKISMNTHSAAWKYFKVRPSGNSKEKEKTIAEYCVYNKTHNDYLYTKAWIEKLIKELSILSGYKKITGRSPEK